MKRFILLPAIFLILNSCSSKHQAPSVDLPSEAPHAFAEKQVRYMATLDLIATLKKDFGSAPELITRDCSELTDSNRSLLGDSSAATGSPVFSEPGSSFVRWYLKCVTRYARVLAEVASSGSSVSFSASSKIFGDRLNELERSDSSVIGGKFSALAPADQLQIVTEAVERFIGPSEVVADFGYFRSSEDLAKKIVADMVPLDLSVYDTMQKVLIQIALRDEFLSY